MVPQTVDAEHIIVSVPADMPVTSPAGETAASAFDTDHAAPGKVAVYDAGILEQTLPGPVTRRLVTDVYTVSTLDDVPFDTCILKESGPE